MEPRAQGGEPEPEYRMRKPVEPASLLSQPGSKRSIFPIQRVYNIDEQVEHRRLVDVEKATDAIPPLITTCSLLPHLGSQEEVWRTNICTAVPRHLVFEAGTQVAAPETMNAALARSDSAFHNKAS